MPIQRERAKDYFESEVKVVYFSTEMFLSCAVLTHWQYWSRTSESLDLTKDCRRQLLMDIVDSKCAFKSKMWNSLESALGILWTRSCDVCHACHMSRPPVFGF